MKNTTLEQKASRIKIILRECHNCGRILRLSENFDSLESNRKYLKPYKVFKSPEGNPHCDKYCFTMFTED